MSLATRITVVVLLVLSIGAVAAGVAFHRSVRRALENELQGRLDARIAWLNGALDVELDDGEVQLDAPSEPVGLAEYWQVATADGRILWAAAGKPSGEVLQRSKTLHIGDSAAPPTPGNAFVSAEQAESTTTHGRRAGWTRVPLSEIPSVALNAARGSIAGFTPTAAERRLRIKKKDANAGAIYDLAGTTAGREYVIRVSATGEVQRINDQAINPFTEYELPEGSRHVELVLNAQMPAAAAQQELRRLARILWITGPLFLMATGSLLAILIRWQLRPLSRMARQAAKIGPATADERIEPAGSSLELVGLRQAINSMLSRLAEGLDRERRFASIAAHELRTPLAQMRATIDVILRRTRDAGEYRQSLQEISTDVDRLEKLVGGLLQLARSADSFKSYAHPISLGQLLRSLKINLPEPGHDLFVCGDAQLLQSAIQNVLDNAARYAPHEPPQVRIETEPKIIRLLISDRGPGVPPDDRERIFEPLTRLHPTQNAVEGFGLGLAVARATVRGFGGDLTCQARSDDLPGAVFVFTFQKGAPPAGVPLDEPQPASSLH